MRGGVKMREYKRPDGTIVKYFCYDSCIGLEHDMYEIDSQVSKFLDCNDVILVDFDIEHVNEVFDQHLNDRHTSVVAKLTYMEKADWKSIFGKSGFDDME